MAEAGHMTRMPVQTDAFFTIQFKRDFNRQEISISFLKTFMMKTSKMSLQIIDWNKYDPNASECFARWVPIKDIKVRFCQKILMFLSYLQTDEFFIFLNLKI